MHLTRKIPWPAAPARAAIPMDETSSPPSGVGCPFLLAGRVGHARIVTPRRLHVTERLRRPDLRGEIPEEGELLHHVEIVRRRVLGCSRRCPGVRTSRPSLLHIGQPRERPLALLILQRLGCLLYP